MSTRYYSLDLTEPSRPHVLTVSTTEDEEWLIVRRLCHIDSTHIVRARRGPHRDTGEIALAATSPDMCRLCRKRWEDLP